jgi:hypothetical protein
MKILLLAISNQTVSMSHSWDSARAFQCLQQRLTPGTTVSVYALTNYSEICSFRNTFWLTAKDLPSCWWQFPKPLLHPLLPCFHTSTLIHHALHKSIYCFLQLTQGNLLWQHNCTPLEKKLKMKIIVASWASAPDAVTLNEMLLNESYCYPRSSLRLRCFATAQKSVLQQFNNGAVQANTSQDTKPSRGWWEKRNRTGTPFSVTPFVKRV